MNELNVLEKIRNFSKDDSVFELNLNNTIFIKHKHNNSVFLYSKSFYPHNLWYTVESKYNYAGVYNITTDEFFDVHSPLNAYVEKIPSDFKELKSKILDEININVAKEMTENGHKYFDGLTVPEENKTTENDLLEKVNSDIFKGCKQELKDTIFIDYAGCYLDCEKIDCVEVENILDYLDNPQKLIQEYTKEIFEKRRNILFLQYENYKLYSKKFDEIINDDSNVINKKKVIKEALKDKKTVNVTILKNGRELTFKTSTRSFIHNWSCGYSLYDLPAQDRKKYKELFRYEDYTFTEIQKITYGKKEIYIKEQEQ